MVETSVNPVKKLLEATEVDTRILGMVAVLGLLWLGFGIATDGAFLTPRNLWNLSVQTSSIAVMATGMVLVIVTRNIDLSVGSLLGFTGMIIAVTQAEWLPALWGYDHSMTWVTALLVGMVAGALAGALQGFVIAYMGVPAFIVTLGGLLAWRGAAWWVTSGRTVAPMDSTFQIMGGGPSGSVGELATWLISGAICLMIVAAFLRGRHLRRLHQFPLRPVWAEFVLAGFYCAGVMGAAAVANAYPWPSRIAERYAQAEGIPIPEGGLVIAHGFAVPVLIAVFVAVVMSFIATRTRFGRYVFAIGGNPEAAELAGVNTRKVILLVFTIMGILAAIGAAISTARLNAATNAQGTLDELYVIAAAVIGGTSLAGGVGKVAGAVLGALVMQSLQSGMVLVGIDTPLQNMIVGVVLVIAVWVDTLYRKRSSL
ncbi:sugar ABC transporter permease [Saccharospirillum alexandrii]|uniref:sugar ABC transporter permease n=1 Tax=Saccharospirillum alexandrii TaxID=2448477 RepID=UPI001FE8EFF3|nr:sugar ABC transporter permease [Saccharospirillum alexandrii]